MTDSYLEKILQAALEATRGNARKAKDLIIARATKDETLLKTLAMTQIFDLVDLTFSEYAQKQRKPANRPKLNDKALDKVVEYLDTNIDVTPKPNCQAPQWKAASSNLVVMRSQQKPLSKKELDHILDQYF